ncbi:MAG: alkaline phosphatase family protein, partial [Thermoanaerobaculia bacterium]|nr:alkaline phosphatase family protein [Thermoanaerobaculia bacterium]
ITGDHGFVNVHTVVAPNVWLVEAGLMDAADDRGDWRATFHTAGGAAFLHLAEPGDQRTLEKVRRALDEQPPRLRKLFRIVERQELDAIGAAPEAELALAGFLGVAFTADGAGEAVRPGSGGTHGYFPSDFSEIHTGFVGWGSGFASGGFDAHLIGLEDVAPLIADLLGVELETYDGTAPSGLLVSPPE